MNFKNNKRIKVLTLASIIVVGILGGGYSLLKKDITLTVKDKEMQVSTFKDNVKDLLEEQNVKYDGNDIVTLELSSKLKDGSKIEVIDVKEETVKESKDIPYKVNIVEDSELLKGKSKVSNEGQTGRNELVYKVIYHNGQEIEKKFIEELVVSKPVNKIVKKGTKVEEIQLASSRGESTRAIQISTNSRENTEYYYNTSSSQNGNKMRVVATAYTGHSITSTGSTPRWGTIAVDPSVIPYGTKVYIPQLGKTFIAEDCGGAINGNKIDIYMNDEGSVYNWGRKTIEIYIVG